MAVYVRPTSGHRRPRPGSAGLACRGRRRSAGANRRADTGRGRDQAGTAGWAVADGVRTLSPDHRAVLLETHYRGRTRVEATRALSIPLGTVKPRTHHALNALRPALQEREPGLCPCPPSRG
ncbi:sigma factor-like helix-turn-helix DNA-binding protein [Streptomyces sp. DSM 118148]|uniref:sigma factor-like helix-turn-helix DNA-binding protein n=1 Tax=Streptomyces sp. DSM 118148 TaxID=3448667 RepID=UPI00403FF97E